MQERCTGRFVALSYGRNGDGDDQSGVKMPWLGFVPYAFMPSRPFRPFRCFHFSFFHFDPGSLCRDDGCSHCAQSAFYALDWTWVETGILFRRSHRQSKYTGIVGLVGIKFTKPSYWMGAKRLLFGCTRHILAVNWQCISCASDLCAWTMCRWLRRPPCPPTRWDSAESRFPKIGVPQIINFSEIFMDFL